MADTVPDSPNKLSRFITIFMYYVDDNKINNDDEDADDYDKTDQPKKPGRFLLSASW